MSQPLPMRLLLTLTDRGWLVGGALRDELLGRPTRDFDVVVEGNVRRLARDLARASRAHSFALSEAFGAWRVIARDRTWQVDLTPLMGQSLQEDLVRRDLTVNALARRLGDDELLDPHGGLSDLRARRLRMVSDEAFREDPLRVVRVARLAAELRFNVEPRTARCASVSAAALGDVAPERVFAELRQIVGGPASVEGLELLEDLGAAAVILPELVALRGVQQSDYHHLDAHDHTVDALEQTIALTADPAGRFPAVADDVSAVLAEPLADELTRAQAMRFGALFHDLAKAATRDVTAEGRVTFLGHDAAGAELAVEVLARLRASERLTAHVAALTRHHLRLGFLVHEMPLSRRAVYRYLRTCEPVEVDVTLLSVADRLATRGRNSEAAIERHMQLASEILPEALRWRAQRPRPPVRGDRLAHALGIRPGPEIGRLLEELTEAAFAGEVQTEEEALAWARAR